MTFDEIVEAGLYEAGFTELTVHSNGIVSPDDQNMRDDPLLALTGYKIAMLAYLGGAVPARQICLECWWPIRNDSWAVSATMCRHDLMEPLTRVQEITGISLMCTMHAHDLCDGKVNQHAKCTCWCHERTNYGRRETGAGEHPHSSDHAEKEHPPLHGMREDGN